MKKILFLLLILISSNIRAQEGTEVLAKPNEGKCMVYIARRETAAAMIKFAIYDGDLPLGKLGARKYFAYECDPGQHAFIAKSENTVYVDANLEAGKTYVLNIKAKMGVVYARVGIVPLCKGTKKFEKQRQKFLEFIEKRKGELLTKDEETKAEENVKGGKADGTDSPGKRMKKFQEMKNEGKKMVVVSPDMYFE